MRKKSKNIVREKVYEATYYMLVNKIPSGDEIGLYMEDIFQRTLSNLAKHFLDGKKLRKSEKTAVETLQQDLTEKQELYIVEKNLHRNLNHIKPIWGEFFGCDRGEVFDTFLYLRQWPCFTPTVRNRIKSSHIRKLQSELFKKTIQLQQASNSLKRNDQITGKTAQRSAFQFIKIQQLEMENKTLKLKLKEAQKQRQPTRRVQSRRENLKGITAPIMQF